MHGRLAASHLRLVHKVIVQERMIMVCLYAYRRRHSKGKVIAVERIGKEQKCGAQPLSAAVKYIAHWLVEAVGSGGVFEMSKGGFDVLQDVGWCGHNGGKIEGYTFIYYKEAVGGQRKDFFALQKANFVTEEEDFALRKAIFVTTGAILAAKEVITAASPLTLVLAYLEMERQRDADGSEAAALFPWFPTRHILKGAEHGLVKIGVE